MVASESKDATGAQAVPRGFEDRLFGWAEHVRKNVVPPVDTSPMNTFTAHRVQTTVDDHHYSIDLNPVESASFDLSSPESGALITHSPEAGLRSGRFKLTATVFDGDGKLVASGTIESARQVLAPLIRVIGASLGSTSMLQSGRGGSKAPANGGAPWSERDDAELERGWLEGLGVAELATRLDRSLGSIRQRLPRVGCDPQRPGHYLPIPPSQRRPPTSAVDQDDGRPPS